MQLIFYHFNLVKFSALKQLKVALFVFSLSSICFAGSPLSNQDVIAEVGSKKITVQDFNKFLMNNLQSCGRISALSPENMQTYLDSLININLLLCNAEENGITQKPDFIKKIDRFKNELLADKLIETQVIDSIITLERLKNFYEKFGGELRLRQIVVRFNNDSSKAKDKVQNIYEKINNGLEFSEAAKKFSEDAMTSSSGGDIGFVRWGQLSENIQNIAFDLKPGEVSHLIKTPFGYYLIQLVSKIKCDFNDELRNLKYQMTAFYTKLIENNKSRYLIKLEKKYGLKLVNSNIKKIAENVGSPYDPFKSFSENLFKIPLARYGDSGSITLNDIINSVGDDLTNYRWDERNISKHVSRIGLNKISVLEARELGLDVNEDLKRYKIYQVINLTENNLWDQNVSENEIRNYFNKNENDFTFPDRIRVQYILVAEHFIAEEILKKAKEGKDFAQLVDLYTLDAISRKTNGDIGFISRDQFQEVYDFCSNLKINEIGGPVAVPQGFAIVKLLDKESARKKTFEEAKKEISSILLKRKKDASYTALINKLKKDFNPIINKNVFSAFMQNTLGNNLTQDSNITGKAYAKTSD